MLNFNLTFSSGFEGVDKPFENNVESIQSEKETNGVQLKCRQEACMPSSLIDITSSSSSSLDTISNNSLKAISPEYEPVSSCEDLISLSSEPKRHKSSSPPTKKKRRRILESSSSDSEDDAFQPVLKKSKSESPSGSEPKTSRCDPSNVVPSQTKKKITKPVNSTPVSVPADSGKSQLKKSPQITTTQEILDILEDPNVSSTSSPQKDNTPTLKTSSDDSPTSSDSEKDSSNNSGQPSSVKSNPPKRMQFIHNAPAPRLVSIRQKRYEKATKMAGGCKNNIPYAQEWLNKKANAARGRELSPSSKSAIRKEKLKEVAEKEKESREEENIPFVPIVENKVGPKFPAGVKLTNRSRNQGLVDSITKDVRLKSPPKSTSHNVDLDSDSTISISCDGIPPIVVLETPAVARSTPLMMRKPSCNAESESVPEEPVVLPLDRIQKDMIAQNRIIEENSRKQKLEQKRIEELRNQNRPNLPIPSVKENSKTLMTKPGALRTRTPSPAIGSVSSRRKSGPTISVEDIVYDEDDPYFRMLSWNVRWLQVGIVFLCHNKPQQVDIKM